MKLVKCPACKIKIPAKCKKCPVCKRNFSKWDLFRMHYLKKTILIVLIIIFLFNCITIILFNRSLRNLVNSDIISPEKIERLEKRYNKLNFLQKKFIHVSELEYLISDIDPTSENKNVLNTNMRIYFDTGSIEGIYSGETKDTKAQGKGKFDYIGADGLGYVYEGEFNDSTITGYGTLINEHGIKSVGYFKNGILSGEGKIYDSEGYLTHDGYFINGSLNGEGTLTYKNNIVYQGNFKQNIPDMTTYKKICTQISPKSLNDNTDSYIAKNICLEGYVYDIILNEETKETNYLLNIDGNQKYKLSSSSSDKTILLNTGDYITLYGYCKGITEITDNMGNKNSSINFHSFFIEKK